MLNSQIFIIAAIATLISIIPIILIQFWLKFNWKYYIIPLLIMLPGSAIINLGLKDWIFLGLSQWSPNNNYVLFLVYFPIWVLIVGITEELFKIIPIAIPRFKEEMKSSELTKVQIGWSLGIGFGIGEIWYLAFLIALDPNFEGIRWFLFTGFLFERVLVVILHAGMTILTLYGFNKKKLWLTIILGIISHGIIDYIAVASLYLNEIYILFIIISIISIPLIILAFIIAQSNDRKKKWKDTLQEDWQELEEKQDNREIEVISLFPKKDNNK